MCVCVTCKHGGGVLIHKHTSDFRRPRVRVRGVCFKDRCAHKKTRRTPLGQKTDFFIMQEEVNNEKDGEGQKEREGV